MSSLALRSRCYARSSFVAVVFCASLLAACGDDTAPPAEVDGGAVTDAPFDGGAPDLTMCADDDGDGRRSVACGGDDCDDADPDRFPGNPEICDGDDEDCNDTTFGPDRDSDGFVSIACCNGPDNCGPDCNDVLNTVNPGATEVCNGDVDDDCNGLADGADGVCVPCGPGLSSVDTTCVDIDECTMGLCGAAVGATCNNTYGSYECTCPTGYIAPPSGGTCADVDDCAVGRCGAGIATCTNTVGSYACTCAPGYSASAASGAPCVDDDECATGTPCGAGGSCANIGGGYTCTCSAGYTATGRTGGTGGTCSDLDECTLTTDDCDASPAAVCMNTVGGFTCACPPGFTGTGRGSSGCDTPRFTALGDGTVGDNNGSGLEWQQGFSPGTQSQAASITYCTTLALDGGGWRLPTIDELRSIVDSSRGAPTIDTSFFPGTPSTPLWSSSPVAGSPSNGWLVDFNFGNAFYSGASIMDRARCVR